MKSAIVRSSYDNRIVASYALLVCLSRWRSATNENSNGKSVCGGNLLKVEMGKVVGEMDL
jgi:hypothetical protein